MSTYEEFMIILATASLIVAILNYTHKNSRPALGGGDDYFRLLTRRDG